MKRVALTQRVDVLADRNECRDALDQRWCQVLAALDALPIPLPNQLADVAAHCRALAVDAVILTGGNDLAASPIARTAAPERDALELALLDHCHDHGIPVLGVCRGMEMINHWRGGRLTPVSGHVACRHDLSVVGAARLWEEPLTVNSYHDVAIRPDDVGEGLEVLALAEDGTVEAVRLPGGTCHGIMWHPEREAPFADRDLGFMADVLGLRR